MNIDTLELKNLIEGFKLTCQTEGKSPRTIEWYFALLTRFQHFLEDKKILTDLGQIGEEDVRTFIRYCKRRQRTRVMGNHYQEQQFKDMSVH
jgi:site-specific recombinase XerD